MLIDSGLLVTRIETGLPCCCTVFDDEYVASSKHASRHATEVLLRDVLHLVPANAPVLVDLLSSDARNTGLDGAPLLP